MDYFKKAQVSMSNGTQGLLFEIMEMLSDQISTLMVSALSSTSPLTEKIKR